MLHRRLRGLAFSGIVFFSVLLSFSTQVGAQIIPPSLPSFRPIRVFDTNNQVVGFLASPNSIYVKINGAVVELAASQNGFDNSGLAFYHKGSSCGGTRYFFVNMGPAPFVSAGAISGGKIIYGVGPFPDLRFCGSSCPSCPGPDSIEMIPPGSDPSVPGTCQTISDTECPAFSPTVGSPVIADFPQFTPPFRTE